MNEKQPLKSVSEDAGVHRGLMAACELEKGEERKFNELTFTMRAVIWIQLVGLSDKMFLGESGEGREALAPEQWSVCRAER